MLKEVEILVAEMRETNKVMKEQNEILSAIFLNKNIVKKDKSILSLQDATNLIASKIIKRKANVTK